VGEGVGANPPGCARRVGCGPDGLLQAAFVQVVAADDAAARVYGKPVGRRDILPDPLVGIGVFALQGVGQIDRVVTFGRVLFVRPLDDAQMILQGDSEAFGQHGHPVFFSLAVADEDDGLGKVQVLDAQAQAFHPPQAGTAE
jgi:hypothetical protein